MSQKSRVRSPHGAHIFLVWGCSSNGRASALNAEGTGIDTLLLHFFANIRAVLAEWLRRMLKAHVRKSVGSIPTDCIFVFTSSWMAQSVARPAVNR